MHRSFSEGATLRKPGFYYTRTFGTFHSRLSVSRRTLSIGFHSDSTMILVIFTQTFQTISSGSNSVAAIYRYGGLASSSA